MPGAFFHGTVKNQAPAAAEPLQISSCGSFALLNFHHSREKSSCEKFSRSAPSAQAKLAQTPRSGVMPL
jgi:hypothetical protein